MICHVTIRDKKLASSTNILEKNLPILPRSAHVKLEIHRKIGLQIIDLQQLDERASEQALPNFISGLARPAFIAYYDRYIFAGGARPGATV